MRRSGTAELSGPGVAARRRLIGVKAYLSGNDKIPPKGKGSAYRNLETMSSKSETPPLIRFGVFELDVENHQLSKNGFRIRLQELPLRLLVMLLERRGDVVTREELQHALWPGDQYGEFDIGLNTAVTKLRQALGDSAHSPRYVETVPRVGYRFIGQINQISEPPASPSTATPAPDGGVHGYRIAAFAFGLALLAVSGVHFNESRPAPQEHPTRRFSFDAEGARDAVISPDGRYVAYVSETERGRSVWLRSLVTEGAFEVAGTEGAAGVFWAPDSASLAGCGKSLLG